MKFVWVAAALVLAGCGKDSGSEAKGNSPYAGVWMQANEAQELRTTGKIESLCPELRKDADTIIVNVRLVDSFGTTFLYVPDENPDRMKMGEIANDGNYKSTMQELGDNGQTRVSMENDQLIFHYRFGKSETKMPYLRSSAGEARAYYAAQEACRH